MLEDRVNNPVFTVITVVYNGAVFIEDCIKSVVNQEFEDYEFIIIDGASTDNTVDFIQKYEESLAYWVSEPDNGIYDAMNKGVDRARGEYIYFLGVDDLLKDGCLQHLFDYIKEFSLKKDVVLYGNVEFKEQPGITCCGRFNRYKLLKQNIPHQAIFYPSEVLKKIKFDLKYKLLADYALNLKLFNNNLHWQFIDIVIAKYSLLGLSSNVIDQNFSHDKKLIIKSNYGYLDFIIYKVVRFLHRFING